MPLHNAIAKQFKLTSVQSQRLGRQLKKEGIVQPQVLRDHRARGRTYHELIFGPAKTAPEHLGVEPFKMINFGGLYIVDAKAYREKVEKVRNVLSSQIELQKFSEGKNRIDKEMERATAVLRASHSGKINPKIMADSLRNFLDTRAKFAGYSFFLDTIYESVSSEINRLVDAANSVPGKSQQPEKSRESSEAIQWKKIPDERKHFAFNFPEVPVEVERANAIVRLKRQMRKAQTGTRKDKAAFAEMLDHFMEEYADLNFVNFERDLQTREEIIEQIKKTSNTIIPTKKYVMARMREKGSLLNELFYGLPGKLKPERPKLWALFELAGNIGHWELANRQIWTRAHREVKIIMGILGEMALKKGLVKNRKDVYRKTVQELISLAGKMG